MRKGGFTGWLSTVGDSIRAAFTFESGTIDEMVSHHGFGGYQTASGAIVNSNSALRVAAVYACVRLISGAVKNMPLQIKRRVSSTVREPADDHAVHKLLNRKPNNWMTPSGFKQLMASWALLRGDGCAQIVRSLGKPVALLPLHPDRLSIKQLDDLSVVYTYTTKAGGQVTLPANDVFHFMPFTLDGVSGVTPITYARETIGLSLTTEQHGATVFKNGTHVGAVLKAKKKLDKEAQDTLRASLEAYRGAAHAGKNLILEEDMDFEKLGMTAEDAQYIETRKFSRSDIAMFFGVPPHMIGDTDSSTSWGTGIEAMSTGFVTYTLEDYLTAFEEAVNSRLIPANDNDIYARFNRAALVRGDMKTRWEAYTKGLQWGVYCPDDVRANEDMNPRPDGKGGIFYDPPNTAGKSSSTQDESEFDNEPAPAPARKRA